MIYEKMAAITAAMGKVAKELKIETGGGKSYSAVSEDTILEAVRPLEEAHKVYSYPAERRMILQDMIEKTSEYKGQAKTTTSIFCRCETVYKFIDLEDGSEMSIVSYGDGFDPQDKAPGKAMTYADKYALMKAYKIRTGDDPDQNASEEGRQRRSIDKARPDLNAEPQMPTAAKKAVPKAEKPKQEAPALLASNETKKAILGRAKALGVDVPALLADCGWKEGEKLTAEQAERAEYRLGEIEKSRAKKEA